MTGPLQTNCRCDSHPRRLRFAILALGSLGLLAPQVAQGQPRKRVATPPPVDKTLTTRDGVELKTTYYPSTAGTEATCVVLLHDYNESRAALSSVAKALQDPQRARLPGNETRAVLTVDLRGHGESKTAYLPGGNVVELDAARFRSADFQRMVSQDMEAVRSFLVAENDAKRLNLNKLCLVGSGMGANVALVWAEQDWRTPDLPIRKQGRDVKGLVLLSPKWKQDGLPLVSTLKFPPIQRGLPIFLAYGGENSTAVADGDNIYKLISKYRPEPSAKQPVDERSLVHVVVETRLQGTELISRSSFGLVPRISKFLESQLDGRTMAWVARMQAP
jgi:pimeloyl-ACP methyl ester carboxylesterase